MRRPVIFWGVDFLQPSSGFIILPMCSLVIRPLRLARRFRGNRGTIRGLLGNTPILAATLRFLFALPATLCFQPLLEPARQPPEHTEDPRAPWPFYAFNRGQV